MGTALRNWQLVGAATATAVAAVTLFVAVSMGELLPRALFFSALGLVAGMALTIAVCKVLPTSSWMFSAVAGSTRRTVVGVAIGLWLLLGCLLNAFFVYFAWTQSRSAFGAMAALLLAGLLAAAALIATKRASVLHALALGLVIPFLLAPPILRALA